MKNITNKLEKRFPKPVAFIREISEIWVSERPNQLAAALAYFGLFSFAPVIYIALTIAGIFIDQAAALERFLIGRFPDRSRFAEKCFLHIFGEHFPVFADQLFTPSDNCIRGLSPASVCPQ
jgi:uncharacterized BrkB/YihY/UPF0761 family membrane protein